MVCQKCNLEVLADGGDELLTPPAEFADKEGRQIQVVGYDGGVPDDTFDSLTAMYVTFRPSNRAQGTPPQTKNSVREWLPSVLQGVGIIAWYNDRIVGHAMLVPDDKQESYELGIYVLQAYQNAGIGTKLMQTLLGSASRHNVKHIWLTVENWNQVAIALYKKIGFRETGFKNVYGRENHISVKRMERSID